MNLNNTPIKGALEVKYEAKVPFNKNAKELK